MDPSGAYTACISDTIACAKILAPTESELATASPSLEEGKKFAEEQTPDDDCGLQPSEEDFRAQKLREANSKTNHGYSRIIRNFTPSYVICSTSKRAFNMISLYRMQRLSKCRSADNTRSTRVHQPCHAAYSPPHGLNVFSIKTS